MGSSEERLDTIEAQSSTGVHNYQRKLKFPMSLINHARTLNLRGFLGEGTPPMEETEYVPGFLTNLGLSDLYNLPDRYVSMSVEIFSAMRAGNKEYLEKMESYGTPMPCFKNDEGDSILHLAAAWGHLELVKGIVSKWPSLLLESNLKDQLPLHVASRSGHSAVVKALIASFDFFSRLSSSSNVQRLNLYVVKDKDGNTPLHLALIDLHEKTELLIYQKRFSLSHCLMHWLRYIPISFLDTSTRQTKTAAYLVNANQRVSFLANEDGISPFYMAVEIGCLALVKVMLNGLGNNVQGQISNLASQLEGRKSLVHAALKSKNTDVLDVILKEDPSLVNERDEEERTCLSVGASVGYYEGICKLLVESPLMAYECDKYGSFPIHTAIEKGHTKVAKEILKRCPGSECLLNNQSQNILHVAVKSGKGRPFLGCYIWKLDRKKKHLIEEQDEDGNTPLHIATINWRPRMVKILTDSASPNTKILNIQNKNGLKALDIAELNLQSDYVLRERMTLMVLLCAYAPKGFAWIPTTGMTLRSRSEHLDANKYKDKITALLVVAALVATVTFAAGFTMPGGFSSSGNVILSNNVFFSLFLVCDTLALQCSLVAIVALIWAQLGDTELVHRAFHLALPSLFVALVSMSLAFCGGVMATTMGHTNSSLAGLPVSAGFYYYFLFFLFAPFVIPQVPGLPFLSILTRIYLNILVCFVNEDEAEKHDTSGPSVGQRGMGLGCSQRGPKRIKKRMTFSMIRRARVIRVGQRGS